MASSSSSHPKNEEVNAFSGIEPDSKRRKVCESSRLFDVFINHRGPDVKETLAMELYKSLEGIGIRAFLDSEEKELGVSFTSTIETAIKSASVHIAIFSEKYAESAWCLAELVQMLRSKAKIIPVFYGVEPRELRYIEKGKYAKAFTKYEKKRRYLEKLPEWKEALRTLSFIAGVEFNGDCKSIIAAVQKEVERKICLHVAKYPVGLNNLVENFERRCLDELVQDFEDHCGFEEGEHKVKVVGIYGMGGSGKTTLVKELFNRKSSNYCKASFLSDVGDAYVNGRLHFLQLKLLKDLFQIHNHNTITSRVEATSYLYSTIQRSPKNLSFLIVVDDIDHIEQLNDLMIMEISNKFDNTLVIVTTRDAGVLITAGITVRYNLEGMDRNNARELFCWHAFHQPHSSREYKELVDAFIDVCGGLPLSLQVLGCHVHGRSRSVWESTLIEAKKTLPRDVQKRLKRSFDVLGTEEKQIFMDIACFFIGKPKSIAERVWEGSGWNAQHALETLKDKCLVKETEILSVNIHDKCLVEESEILSLNMHEGLVLRMHDHLRDLGREMARDLKPPCRLWHPNHLNYLEPNGFKSLAQSRVRCYHSIFDESMSYRVTFFLGQPDFSVETSASLLWLELNGNSTEQPSIPSWISLQNVQCLKIKNTRLKTLWESPIQAPSQLKELQISDTFLEKFPDFSGISDNLEKVFLDVRGWPIQGLSLLESLSMNICSLCVRSSTLKGVKASSKTEERTTCESLVIRNFKFSGEVAWNNRGMSSSVIAPMAGLEKLEISGEEIVSKILISGIHYPSLESIKLHYMENLTEVDLISIKTLNCLDITNCRHLKSVSGINNLAKLVELVISDCGRLEFERLCLSGIRSLERMIFDRYIKVTSLKLDDCQNLKTIKYGCKMLAKLGSCEKLLVFEGLIYLESIIINGCGEFKYLRLDGCQNLKSVSGNLEIRQFYIRNCPELEELPSFSGLSCVEEICIACCGKLRNIMLPTRLVKLSVESCRGLERVSGTGDLIELKELYIKECPELEELPSLPELSCVEEIRIAYCENLRNIMLPTRLIKLNVRSCRDLHRVSGIGHLIKLEELCINECPELEELPSLSRLSRLQKIEIYSCEKLQKMAGIEELRISETMKLCYCGNTVIRNCIHKLESVPLRCLVIGRAVDGAESSLNEYLFSDADIGADALTDFVQFGAENTNGELEKWKALSRVILCCVVLVDSSTSVEDINKSLHSYYGCQVREGEWIITMVGNAWRYRYLMGKISDVLRRCRIMKKGFWVEVKKGEEGNAVRVLHTIVDKLHHS